MATRVRNRRCRRTISVESVPLDRVDSARNKAGAHPFDEMAFAGRSLKNAEVQGNTCRRVPSGNQVVERAIAAETPCDVVGRTHRKDAEWNLPAGEHSCGGGDGPITASCSDDVGAGLDHPIHLLLDHPHKIVSVLLNRVPELLERDGSTGFPVVEECDLHMPVASLRVAQFKIRSLAGLERC